MEPRPAHSGGSESSNAGAELAALISARGTSVCVRRSITFGKPVVAGVWQTGKSGPTNGSDMSVAGAPAPARVMMFPACSVASAAPPSAAAPAETSSRWDRVIAAMLYSKIGKKKSAESEISTGRTEPGPKKTPDANIATFPSFLQDDFNICALAE